MPTNHTLTDLSSGSAIADADLFYSVQGGTSVKQTGASLRNHVLDPPVTVGDATNLDTAEIIVNNDGNPPAFQNASWQSGGYVGGLGFTLSRSTTIGNHALLAADDTVLDIFGKGSDGTAFRSCVHIVGEVDDTPALNSMPGRLRFETVSTDSVSLVERQRIDSAGLVTVSQDAVQGGASTTGRMLVADFKTNKDQTILVSRTEGGGGPSIVGSAIKVITVVDSDGVSQGEGLSANVQTSNGQDVVGVSATARHTGSGNKNAFGFFAQAIAVSTASGAFAFQTDVQNQTGAAVPYTQTANANKFVGVDLVYDSTTAGRDSGCAAQIRWNGGSGWDVGVGIQAGGVKTSIVDNSAACVTLWNDTAAHTNGFNLSGATFTGAPILAPLMSVVTTTGTGTTGSILWSTAFIYICVGTNSWKRAAISTW